MTQTKFPTTTPVHDFAVPMLMVFTLAISSRGCQQPPNMSIDDAHMTATSPEADVATQSNPVIVTRDNPNLGGGFDIQVSGVSSSANGPYNYNGTWTNLTGLAKLREIRADGVVKPTQSGPLLPQKGQFTSPSTMGWNTRFGGLVHENVYDGSVEAKIGAAQTNVVSNRALWMKLSDDTRLVPVVVINWRRAGVTFVDHTRYMRAALDFINYVAPPHLPSSLSVAQLRQPNTPSVNITNPELGDAPPDDIFHQCGVQFQMVASFTFDLPANHTFNCTSGTPTFKSLAQVESLVAGAINDSALAARIQALQPMYVTIGDFGPCRDISNRGHVIPTIRGRLLELDYVRTPAILAHELGHALGLVHNESTDNLMNGLPGTTDKIISSTQCTTVRGEAANYSDRYRDFNAATGRTYRAPEPIVIAPPVNVCCSQGGNTFETTNYMCLMSLGGIVPMEQCNRCCAEGNIASMKPLSQCSGSEVPAAQCNQVCCSNPVGNTSAYACHQSGGAPMAASNCDIICCSTANGKMTRLDCTQSGGTEVMCTAY